MMDDRLRELAKERLLSRVEKTDSCWLWKGALSSRGYGSMTFMKKGWSAHRLAYTAFRGDIPDGLFVCHSCDVRACVNPDHLWVGTGLDNQRDARSKGRLSAQLYADSPLFRRRVRCKWGHEYAVVGVHVQVKRDGRVGRSCGECRRLRDASRNDGKRGDWTRGLSELPLGDRFGSGGAMDSATDF